MKRGLVLRDWFSYRGDPRTRCSKSWLSWPGCVPLALLRPPLEVGRTELRERDFPFTPTGGSRSLSAARRRTSKLPALAQRKTLRTRFSSTRKPYFRTPTTEG
jgi:hypothetical protein